MKVLILTADSNGGYPVPAVQGGAVSTLIEHLAAGNNKRRLCDMEIISLYNRNAEKKATEEYPNVKFTWVTVPGIYKIFDKCTFGFIRFLRKNKKAISFRSAFSLLYYIHRAKRIVNATDADKIVIENNVPLARVMRDSSFKGQWYYHFHNVPRIDAGCREEFQNVTKFICVSQFVADQITEEESAIGKINSAKTEVLLNCVDTNLFHPADENCAEIEETRRKYGIKKDDFVLIFTGRLSEEKGPDIVLRVMERLSGNVKALIVGSLFSSVDIKSPYQEKLKRFAERLGNRVIFTGYVEQKELPKMYNVANVAVFPSIWDEPAGLTMVESIACGLPVISTDAGGIPEYVGGGIASRTERCEYC